MSVGIISNEDYTKLSQKQQQTNNIVKMELDRLYSKKANMDEKEDNATRLILMHRTQRDKQQQYLVLMTMFILIFGICLILLFMQEKMGIGKGMIDLVVIVLVVIALVTGYFMLMDIWKMDANDFSKLNSTILTPVNKMKDPWKIEQEKGDLSAMASEMCRGEQCCGPGFTYNTNKNKCES